ncbi:hypothetical protein B0A49_10084 [Cryomyces minteri]|uniref:Short-chain dehydrogenase/reductase 3 n=1 Tax=Cryomyces minteri TaxID=331657 RepID=A0A4U0WMW0_9PEZI|nr:hypothetical protein B0A49_10084 [Cryomyces minteri]
MSSFKMPLEGFTLEYLTKPIRGILLQPILTAAVVLASMKKPQDVSNMLSIVSTGKVSPAVFDRTMKVLLGAGILYRLNNLLTKLVLNNWVSDRTWDWKREVVLVTGGCSGIGELIVHKLTEKNIKVAVLDINPPRSPLPTNAVFYKTDVTSSEEIHAVAEKIRQELGHPTVLINNAGIGSCQAILVESEASIRRTFDVNIIAHFLLVREFVPHMIERNHGHIVTIASMASFLVHASNVDYACTKAAALVFHEGLAQELKTNYGANKVRTTYDLPLLFHNNRIRTDQFRRVVHPTWVRTSLIDMLSRKKDFNEFVIEPETVANAVVAQILSRESAQLILTGRYAFATTIRGWPGWLQESARNSVANLLRNAA